MASTSILTALLLLLSLVVSSSRAQPVPINCDEACSTRCSLSSRPKLCHRACGTCCDRCGCVPPGTSGHYEACSCYADMTTHGGRPKCP